MYCLHLCAVQTRDHQPVGRGLDTAKYFNEYSKDPVAGPIDVKKQKKHQFELSQFLPICSQNRCCICWESNVVTDHVAKQIHVSYL